MKWPKMEQRSRDAAFAAETLDTLAAIWILASNDDNAAISYRGLRHRLRIPDHVNERNLVAARGELFRLKIPAGRLLELKDQYRAGKLLPSWLRELPEGDERKAAIDALTTDDYFRSQFRTEPKAPRSPIEIVNWGLQHIERLRKANAEARDERLRRVSAFWIPLLSTLVAVTAVGSSAYLQIQAGQQQQALKQYEVSFRPKADGYTRFIQALTSSFDRTARGAWPAAQQALNEAEVAFVQLEPFLSTQDRTGLWAEYQNFVSFLYDYKRENVGTAVDSNFVAEYLKRRESLRENLYRALFK